MHPVFEEITPGWLDRAHVYTGSIGDFRYRFEQKNKGTSILASVYTFWCYEVAKDVHEKSSRGMMPGSVTCETGSSSIMMRIPAQASCPIQKHKRSFILF